MIVTPPFHGFYKPSASAPDFNPPVTTNLILNWNSKSITLPDGSNIGTGDWFDSSSAGNNPVNTGGVGNPFYRATGGPGGRPTVEFDAVGGSATDSRFDLTSQIAPSDFTMFCVCKVSDSNPRTIISGGTAAFQYRFNALKQEVLRAGVTLYGTGTNAVSTSAFVSINCTFNNTTRAFAFRQGGAGDGSGTGGGLSVSANMKQVAWNEASVVTREPFLGFVSILLIYNAILSGGDISTVETWLTSEWGV